MIEKIVDENNKTTFTFTGRHIYWYIHSISESSSILKSVNELLDIYPDEEKRMVLETVILKHSNGNKIINAINEMMNDGSVSYIKSLDIKSLDIKENNISIKWLEGLYLNQLGHQLDKPTNI